MTRTSREPERSSGGGTCKPANGDAGKFMKAGTVWMGVKGGRSDDLINDRGGSVLQLKKNQKKRGNNLPKDNGWLRFAANDLQNKRVLQENGRQKRG